MVIDTHFIIKNGRRWRGTFLRYEGGQPGGRIEMHKVTEGPEVEDFFKRHGHKPNLMMITAPVSRVTQLALSGLSYDINSIVSSYLGGKSRRKRT